VLQQNCAYLATFDVGWMRTDLGSTVCKFGEDPTIRLGREAILTD